MVEIVERAVKDFVPYARNPRKNDAVVDQMAASIREFGFKVPVLALSDGTIIDGHLRLKAARKLKLESVPVILCDEWTPAQVKAFRLMANKSVSWAEWDAELLRIEMEELKSLDFDLELTGFGENELAQMLEPAHLDGLTDPDSVPELPSNPITAPGDLWILGKHRLLCGDSRDCSAVKAALDGRKANICVTSPPYASQRKYDESSDFKPIHPDKYVDWFADVAANIAENLAEDGSYFLNIKEHCEDGQRHLYVKDLTIAHVRTWGWLFIDEFCWKRAGVPGKWNNRFKNAWEPIFHFSRTGRIKIFHDAVAHESKHVFDYSPANGKSISGSGLLGKEHAARFKEGLACASNVLEIGTGGSKVSGEHPAEYPVALPEFFIRAFTGSEDVVFDPFSGSGSTLIAAEKNGRCGIGIELSPAYCDVTVRRWQDFTGSEAILEGDGRTFAEISTSRHGTTKAVREAGRPRKGAPK